MSGAVVYAQRQAAPRLEGGAGHRAAVIARYKAVDGPLTRGQRLTLQVMLDGPDASAEEKTAIGEILDAARTKPSPTQDAPVEPHQDEIDARLDERHAAVDEKLAAAAARERAADIKSAVAERGAAGSAIDDAARILHAELPGGDLDEADLQRAAVALKKRRPSWFDSRVHNSATRPALARPAPTQSQPLSSGARRAAERGWSRESENSSADRPFGDDARRAAKRFDTNERNER